MSDGDAVGGVSNGGGGVSDVRVAVDGGGVSDGGILNGGVVGGR